VPALVYPETDRGLQGPGHRWQSRRTLRPVRSPKRRRHRDRDKSVAPGQRRSAWLLSSSRSPVLLGKDAAST